MARPPFQSEPSRIFSALNHQPPCWLTCVLALAGLLLLGFWSTPCGAETKRGVKVTNIDGKSPAEFVAGRSGKSWAVVIGVNAYQHVPNLTYAVADAKSISDLFAKKGFKVTSLYDGAATRKAILHALGDQLPAEVGEQDQVVIFFAGHGETKKYGAGNAMGYLLPVDAEANALSGTAIDMGLIQSLAQALPAKQILFLIDSCYGGIAGQRIPIRLLEMPPDTRKVVETTLRTNVQDVDLVGPDQPARFSVDVEDSSLRLLAADGMQVIGTFGLNEPWGAGMATVISRSANASELLTLDNPSSQLKIDVRVASAVKAKPSVGTRGITVVGDTHAAQYHIRKSGKPRTEHNSLQLEIRVNADAYVTIVDVDSEGGVNLLFPNNYQQRSFYGDGFIRTGDPVLIPDSLKPGNKAGFYWDYSPPKGTDTIRVFTSTDLQTAQMIRDRIKALQTSGEQTGTAVKTRSVANTVQSLRRSLATVASRGIVIVADTTTQIPGEVSAPPVALTPPVLSNPAPAVTVPEQPAALTAPAPAMPAASEPVAPAVASNVPAADWTAASVTIVISD